MDALPVIGKHELIHLYKEGIFDIPAKIDTGADKCAIWASSISEKDGDLSFCFFGPGSSLFSGEVYTTSEYTTSPVKNSFGVTEVRYVVKLSVKVGDKNYKVRFSLADRSNNRFPVLLGMNFLKNHFWVNVAESYIQSPSTKSGNKKVAVISSVANEARAAYFKKLESLHKKPVSYDMIALNDLVYWFGKRPRITNGIDGSDIKGYKIAYMKAYKKSYEQAVAAAIYLHHENVAVLDEEVLGTISTSKLSEMMRLNCSALPVPSGIAMATEKMKDHYALLVKHLGSPFVLKEVYSERGKNNYLIHDQASFDKILDDAPDSYYFLAQEYIENNGFYRLLVLRNNIPVVIHRAPQPSEEKLKSHLNKPRGGTNASMVEAAEVPEACSIAMRAAVVMGRQVAGVDIVKDLRGKRWYILEVNSSPQLRNDKFEDQKATAFAQYIEYELERY